MNELEAFNNFFKAKRDQYLVEIRKQKNGQHILAKRIKLAESVTPSKSKQGSVSSSIPSQSSLV